MRTDETGNPTPTDEQGDPRPGYFPDPPNADEHGERSITSSGITLTGGVPVGSASDRKQPDTWARRHGTADNLGPGALEYEEEE